MSIRIWSALFQKAIRANLKIEDAMPMSNLEITFWKRAHHKYTHIHTYIHMCKALFENRNCEHAIAMVSPFFLMAHVAFWKRALHIVLRWIYIYEYICIYKYSKTSLIDTYANPRPFIPIGLFRRQTIGHLIALSWCSKSLNWPPP